MRRNLTTFSSYCMIITITGIRLESRYIVLQLWQMLRASKDLRMGGLKLTLVLIFWMGSTLDWRRCSETGKELSKYVVLEGSRLNGSLIWAKFNFLLHSLTVMSIRCGVSPIYLFLDDIKIQLSLLMAFSYSHVCRAGNTVAHTIARWDLGDSNE